MLQSKIFSKTAKEAPKDEPSKNARLLEQAGYVQKVMAGVYNYLPLGTRVLQKIENLVRQEMSAVGNEVFMPSLHPKENWLATGRWNSVDVLFKIKSIHGFEYALGPTHEEIVAPAARRAINSYRDLPLSVFQIQTKFRDEARAKSGLLRGREFRMKDMYSFHADQADLDRYYAEVTEIYKKVFARLGLKSILTEASGGSFSKYSHEFQVELENGEDTIYICKKCGLAKNKEIFSGPDEQCTNCGKTEWREAQAAEVGNIFKLGTKFTVPFNIKFVDKDGAEQPVLMGCYGIGTTRLMGLIAELFNDSKGLIWPENVAPFQVHLIALQSKDPAAQKSLQKHAETLYKSLQKAGVEVLLDDRDESAGVKFNDADLLGIPWRMVVSEKTLAADSIELKNRAAAEAKLVKINKAAAQFTQ